MITPSLPPPRSGLYAQPNTPNIFLDEPWLATKQLCHLTPATSGAVEQMDQWESSPGRWELWWTSFGTCSCLAATREEGGQHRLAIGWPSVGKAVRAVEDGKRRRKGQTPSWSNNEEDADNEESSDG